jgi:multicomponent Na+:H+ antiporter subunit D
MTPATLSVLVPMIAACLLAAVSPLVHGRRGGGAVAIPGALATVALAALVAGRSGDRMVLWFGGWRPERGVAVGVDFAVDGIGAGLALFAAVLVAAAVVMAVRVVRAEDWLFDALLLVMLAAMIGFCQTGDLFNLFVFFELMSVAAYVLVGYEVRRRAPLEGALTFAITNTVGSLLLLFGIGLLYGRTGALNLAQIGQALAAGPHDALLTVSFALVACGMLVKAAVVPFHLWTADAYAVAPTPIAIVLAGAYSELGLYGLARIYWTAFEPALGAHADVLRAILVGAGVLTALVGTVMCAAQHHLKRMLAFATIAQVGLFLAGIGLLSAAGVAGTAVWIVADGLVKAALFGCIAVVQHHYDEVEERDLHGRARELWPVGCVFVLGALMIASLPLTGSFLGRSLIEDAALEAPGYGWLPAVMLAVTGVLGGTLLRAGLRVFWGLGRAAPEDAAAERADEPGEPEELDRGARVSPLLWAPAVAMLAAAVAWGLLPGLLGAVGRAAAAFVDTRGYAADVLGAGAPSPPAPALHHPGPTAWLYAAGSLALAAVVAAVNLLAPRGVPGPVAAAVHRLRVLHSGRPGDYAALAVTGAAVLGGLFTALLR